MQSIEGVVIIVQETRFQLLDDAGVGHLFLLGHAAALEPEQLAPLQRAQARVRVFYRPAADVIGHRAVRIMPLDSRPSRSAPFRIARPLIDQSDPSHSVPPDRPGQSS